MEREKQNLFYFDKQFCLVRVLKSRKEFAVIMATENAIEENVRTKEVVEQRRCLRCGQLFNSKGPGNRVYPPCKNLKGTQLGDCPNKARERISHIVNNKPAWG